MLQFNIRRKIAVAILFLLMLTDGHAVRLFETNSIELNGTTQIVARGVSTCNVVAESETEYERTKVNDGKPLNVWQVDFSVYNGSGKSLSYLNAFFKIKAEWPPCTNWSELSQSCPKPVLSGGSFQVLQKPYGMESGEEVSDTIYLLVFHEHQPVFESWDVDFRFGELAKESGTAQQAAQQLVPTQQPVPLPMEVLKASGPGQVPEIRAEHLCEGRPRRAKCWKELTSHPQCYIWDDDYEENETMSWTGECVGSFAQGKGTLITHYENSNYMYEEAGYLQYGLKEGWVELDNHPQCYVWCHLFDLETVTWTGECADGFLQGTGTFFEKYIAGQEAFYIIEETGHLHNNKKHGQWVKRDQSTQGNSQPDSLDWRLLEKGSYVDDKKHGHWIERKYGSLAEGPYVEGKKHGDWIHYFSDGSVEAKGPYVNNERHGDWVVRLDDRQEAVSEGPYVNGKRHGRWALRYYVGMPMPTRKNPDNIDWMIIKEEGPYVNGKSHGDYVYYSPDGSVVAKGPYVNNERHGDWVYYSLNGSVVAEGSYANDERSGNWVWYDWYGNVHSTEQPVGSGNSNPAGTSSQTQGGQAQGTMQQALQNLENVCGEKYQGNFADNDHSRFYCMAAFNDYCALKRAQSSDAINKLRASLQQNCAVLKSVGADSKCSYCK